MIYDKIINTKKDKVCGPKTAHYDLKVPCRCVDCPNLATKWLTVLRQVHDGCYCGTCASDLCWHGIAREVMDDEVMS